VLIRIVVQLDGTNGRKFFDEHRRIVRRVERDPIDRLAYAI
jgi:hypothetical protein